MIYNDIDFNLSFHSSYDRRTDKTGNFAKVVLLEIKFKPTSNGKVTVKGKLINSGGGYGL